MKSFAFCVAFVAILLTIASFSKSSSFASATEVAGCHNATGSCSKTHFMCANQEAIPHSKRCDGVEDCADGTDEYLCDLPHTDKAFDHEMTVSQRAAFTEVSCILCTCYKGVITVASSDAAWFKIAVNAPRDLNMLTTAPAVENKPCHPTRTSEINLNVYKKRNKGCRGWVCCLRQNNCKTCNTGALNRNCWP